MCSLIAHKAPPKTKYKKKKIHIRKTNRKTTEMKSEPRRRVKGSSVTVSNLKIQTNRNK